MTVVNPKSISGINSITTASGSDNLLTIHTSDANNTERLRIDSTGTTKIVTGIVTTLTATTGIVTTLTTNTLTANSTTKVGSGVTLSPDGDIFATGVTTTTQFKVTTGANAFETSANVFKGASGQKGVYLRSALSAEDTPSYSSVDDTNTGIFLPGSDVFGVTTGGSERLRIDSSGAAFFKGVSDGTKGTINLESEDPFIRLYDTNGEADKRKWDIRNIGASGYTKLDFRTINDANNSFDSVMQIEHGGDVNISDGNLRVASGHGIDFAATGDASGASSELLDDYEEGTWTPTLSGGTSGNDMYYTKIGRIVHISGSLSFSSISGSGNIIIGGLPYTSIDGLDAYTHLAAHAYDSLDVGNETYQFQTLRVNQNSTQIMIIIPAGNGDVRTFAQYSHVSNSTFRFRVAGYYITG